jgi:hypothetical protein
MQHNTLTTASTNAGTSIETPCSTGNRRLIILNNLNKHKCRQCFYDGIYECIFFNRHEWVFLPV